MPPVSIVRSASPTTPTSSTAKRNTTRRMRCRRRAARRRWWRHLSSGRDVTFDAVFVSVHCSLRPHPCAGVVAATRTAEGGSPGEEVGAEARYGGVGSEQSTGGGADHTEADGGDGNSGSGGPTEEHHDSAGSRVGAVEAGDNVARTAQEVPASTQPSAGPGDQGCPPARRHHGRLYALFLPLLRLFNCSRLLRRLHRVGSHDVHDVDRLRQLDDELISISALQHELPPEVPHDATPRVGTNGAAEQQHAIDRVAAESVRQDRPLGGAYDR